MHAWGNSTLIHYYTLLYITLLYVVDPILSHFERTYLNPLELYIVGGTVMIVSNGE